MADPASVHPGAKEQGVYAHRGRRVLVTGATGFLGSHVVRHLHAAGAEVHAVVRPESPRISILPAGVLRAEADIADADALGAAMRAAAPHVVFHLAADTSARRLDDVWGAVQRSVAVNLQGTLNVLEAAAGATAAGAPLERIVRLGGLEEYGAAPTPYVESQREQPISPYSASQVAATHYCQMLQPQLPFTVVNLRPALVYGPGQSTDFFIPALIASCLRRQPFDMTAGTQRRDLLYVDDLMDALWCAATAPGLAGAVINVGTGVEHAIRDVAAMVARLAGCESCPRPGATADRPRDLEHLVTDTSDAYDRLGWRARTSLEVGLARTVEFLRAAADKPVSAIAESRS